MKIVYYPKGKIMGYLTNKRKTLKSWNETKIGKKIKKSEK